MIEHRHASPITAAGNASETPADPGRVDAGFPPLKLITPRCQTRHEHTINNRSPNPAANNLRLTDD
jgi:hypothetical protein